MANAVYMFALTILNNADVYWTGKDWLISSRIYQFFIRYPLEYGHFISIICDLSTLPFLL